MGIDLASYDQLIARQMTVEGITKHVGADSLAYLSMEGLHAAVREGMPAGGGHCDACFSGKYPVDVSAFLGGPDTKHAFERAAGDE
jgi:amidophosphoribosyltransferase